jgi:hypothetical protein
MSEKKEGLPREEGDFLRRWSRLKRESAAAPAPAKQEAPSEKPVLPPIDSLTFESDFKVFMHSKVEESVKRAALKKLFSDPRFNVMDGLDTYIDDYTKADPIPESLLSQLEHARATLLGPQREEKREEEPEEKDDEPQQEAAQGAEPAESHPKSDDDPGQDPKAL